MGGGVRTSVKANIFANRVNEAAMSAIDSDCTAPQDLEMSMASTSYGMCDGNTNTNCLPKLSSVAKTMALYGSRRKAESPIYTVSLSPQTEGVLTLRSFQFEELKSATRNFRPDCVFGGDGFGSVYMGWIDEHSLAAAKYGSAMAVSIKRFRQQRSLQTHKDWLTEVSCLGQLVHPNLVQLIGYCLEDGMRFHVHEFIPQGSLNMHLYERASQFKPLSWNNRMRIALGAAKGLAFLHSDEVKVIYRAFKTSDIMLDLAYNAKLYGYGLAMVRLHGYRSHVSEADVAMYEEKAFHVRRSVSSEYEAPEISKDDCVYFSEDQSTPKTDVYSYGVVLLEILSGRRAFDDSRPLRQKCLVQFAKNMFSESGSAKYASKDIAGQIFDAHIHGQYSQDGALKALALAIRCISAEPECRPNMNEVVQVLEPLQSSE